MAESSERLLFAIPSGKRDEIQFHLRHYEGRDFLDLRIWFKPEGSTVFKPTRKGLTMGLHCLPDLVEGFEKLARLMPEPVPEKPKPAPARTEPHVRAEAVLKQQHGAAGQPNHGAATPDKALLLQR
jgi:hypothetical protein